MFHPYARRRRKEIKDLGESEENEKGYPSSAFKKKRKGITSKSLPFWLSQLKLCCDSNMNFVGGLQNLQMRLQPLSGLMLALSQLWPTWMGLPGPTRHFMKSAGHSAGDPASQPREVVPGYSFPEGGLASLKLTQYFGLMQRTGSLRKRYNPTGEGVNQEKKFLKNEMIEMESQKLMNMSLGSSEMLVQDPPCCHWRVHGHYKSWTLGHSDCDWSCEFA